MELTIKQLKQHGLIFIPLTTAEAVLVKDGKDGKDGKEIITLDNMLLRKIEQIITPVGSGLVAYPQGTNVLITHTNSIDATESPTPLKVLYDNRGHIISTAPINKATVIVDTLGYMEYDGSKDSVILMGDDFRVDDEDKIILKWNNL